MTTAGTPRLLCVTTLFSHPRQPRRTIAPSVPAAPTRPKRPHPAASPALERPPIATATAIPAEPVPSFIPQAEGVDLRPAAATWDAIASTSRRLRRCETTTIPSDIEPLGRRTRIGIRTFDLLTASVLIVVTVPLMALIAAAVTLTSRGPALYVSWRLGRGGRVFACLKFRTMQRDADARLPYLLAADPHLARELRTFHRLRNDPRVTVVGRFLRRTHLDELPQLFNVLGGSMSLVGPRPIVPKDMEHYGQALVATLSVKPGLTGTWQISKRLGGYAGRAETDLAYVQRRSTLLDLWICVRTALMLIGIGGQTKR